MWLLECDGDLFADKRKWLKPGQKYLFGRTKGDASPDEQFHTINNKSVSRKHLVITVASVEQGHGDHVYEKSELTLTDDSKLGTLVDGDKLLKQSRTLSAKSHKVKLGSYEQTFRITWRPIVFTFSYTLKEQQRAGDILAPFRNKLEPFDIKAILSYSIIDTTHVVASKRNIPKCLQALINAKPIVKESYVDAISRLCASPGVADDGKTALPSPLEDDFDSNWPDALPYLPDAGKEPIARPPDLFAPDPERINVFEGFTFVFAEASQYEQLSPVLTNGGAKAVKFDVKLGQTSLKDFVQFVRNVADEKGIRDLADSESKKKIVVVRLRGKDNTEQWALDFIHGLDLELGQRSIEQNEFLDPILMNDPRPLHRQLEEEDRVEEIGYPNSSSISQRGQIEPTNQSSATLPGEEEQRNGAAENEAPPKPSPKSEMKLSRGRFRRGITESRFKGFDAFDPSQLPKSSNRRDELSEEEDNGEQAQNTTSQMEVDSQPLFVTDSQPGTRSNKRPRPEDEDAGAEMFDTLLPAAAAMKRRRLEQERNGKSAPLSDRSNETPEHQTKTDKPVNTRQRKEIDVRREARSHAQRLDNQRSPRHSERDSDDDGANEDISQLRNLALVEEMPIRARVRPQPSQASAAADTAAAGPDARWDPRWNGLKNFKKFRRQGDRDAAAANRGRRTLVGLEEVKRKDFGIGEHYWLEPSSSSKRDKRNRQGRSQTQTRAQTQTQRADGDGEVVEVPQSGEILPEEVVGEPREGSVADALADTQQEEWEVEETATPAKGKGTGKRAPPAPKTSPPKRKRATRNEPQVIRDVSSDEDELKFRLRRRRG